MSNKEMIHIAICDDDASILDKTNATLKVICFTYKVRFDITTYINPLDLLNNDADRFDIIILDIEMPQLNGMDTAKHLRDNKSRAHIIFLTNYKEYIQNAFEVRAFRYLFKSCSEEEFKQAFDAAVKELLSCDWFYFTTADRVSHQVHVDDIHYVEALGESTVVYTATGEYITTHPLYYWLDCFGTHLYQCHKSYLANLRNVQSVGEKSITLKSGAPIPVSARKKYRIKEALAAYTMKYSKYM